MLLMVVDWDEEHVDEEHVVLRCGCGVEQRQRRQ